MMKIDDEPQKLGQEFHSEHSSKYEICLVMEKDKEFSIYQVGFQKKNETWYLHGQNMIRLKFDMGRKIMSMTKQNRKLNEKVGLEQEFEHNINAS